MNLHPNNIPQWLQPAKPLNPKPTPAWVRWADITFWSCGAIGLFVGLVAELVGYLS